MFQDRKCVGQKKGKKKDCIGKCRSMETGNSDEKLGGGKDAKCRKRMGQTEEKQNVHESFRTFQGRRKE